MRLINTITLQLEDFSLKPIPPYAILSHTWADDEVTFQDMIAGSAAQKTGFFKIQETCRLACNNKLGYAWVDTCCIDKSSSAELTEAINSMFAWYKNSAVCFVYLVDLGFVNDLETELSQCRWWTRGWTLQELLAPERHEYYDKDWTFVGEGYQMLEIISTCSRVPLAVLRDRFRTCMDSMSFAARMSWAARRSTTRIEDEAYCLLGLFDVNMPLIYGEGRRAFRRLLEEIVKRDNDLTILASDTSVDVPNNVGSTINTSLFGFSAANYHAMGGLQRFKHTLEDIAITNKGLKFTGHLPLRLCEIQTEFSALPICCLILLLGRIGDARLRDGYGICLKIIGPRLMQRDTRFPILPYDNSSSIKKIKDVHFEDVYILIDPTPSHESLFARYRQGAIHVPEIPMFDLEDVVPESLWDFEERLFLRKRPVERSRHDMVLALLFRPNFLGVGVLVLGDCRIQPPKAKVLKSGPATGLLFQERCREDSLSWTDFELLVPSSRNLTDTLFVHHEQDAFRVTATLRNTVKAGSYCNLVLDVEKGSYSHNQPFIKTNISAKQEPATISSLHSPVWPWLPQSTTSS